MVVELLIGMIASGKTTYCAAKAAQGKIIVSDDDIVTSAHGGHYSMYDHSLKSLYHSTEMVILSQALTHDRDVVIDRTNLTVEGRERFIRKSKLFDAEVHAVVFPFASPEEHARRRFECDNRGRSYEHWVRVANEHIGKYVEPTVDEGFDKIIVLAGGI